MSFNIIVEYKIFCSNLNFLNESHTPAKFTSMNITRLER